jgi:hypothetical protein
MPITSSNIYRNILLTIEDILYSPRYSQRHFAYNFLFVLYGEDIL